MTPEQLKWLLIVVSNAPIQNLDEAEHKDAWLTKLAQELRESVQE